MRRTVLASFLVAALPQVSASPVDLRFHHLHLRDSNPEFRIDFYDRLFDRSTTRRLVFAGVQGLQTGTRVILVSPGQPVRERAAALWHFGWGKASLGETYLAHARGEVAWEPPLPPEDLHIHLRSADPADAAEWYRDVLDADVQLAPNRPRPRARLPAPEHRLPEALVHLGGIPLLIYPADVPLASSVGQRIDHLAFSCRDLQAALSYLRSRHVVVQTTDTETIGARAVMLVGPDRIAIELVEVEP
jgi:catechol 2,3-dioxygenase-like lactoylglutathione lyase family enzyme